MRPSQRCSISRSSAAFHSSSTSSTRSRDTRGFRDIAQRAGLQLGDGRYLGYSLMAAVATVAILVVWPPPLEPFLREGSPQRAFVGLGLGGRAIAMALLYGVVQT